MLDNNGFDLWADGYDASVAHADESDSYPFAGYRDVLGTIYSEVRARACRTVLDIGFGTGTLLRRFYQDGLTVNGVDFSQRMLELAQQNMKNARLYRHDFTQGLPSALQNKHYDAIISTYALHHLSDAEKPAFIRDLLSRLNPGGILLIGDVAFESRTKLNECRLACGDGWDDEEYYFVFDELSPVFKAATYTQVSSCAGIVMLTSPVL